MTGLPDNFSVPKCKNVLVVAGAGMSADSGLPTFQNRSSRFDFWGALPGTPARRAMEEGMSMLKLFRVHPELAWPMYLHRLEACQTARMHDGYRVLAEIAKDRNLAVLTSNVDGLFPRARFSVVHECHGQIGRLQCSTPCRQETWVAEPEQIRDGLSVGRFPVCPWCGGAARANISWGESTYVHAESDVRARRLAECVKSMVTEPTLVIECGVSHESGLRRYADDLHAKHESVFLLRINPEAEAVNGNRLLAIRSTAEAALVSLFLGARD
jgi:NAD-dependent SIR2 family protein deacetylase